MQFFEKKWLDINEREDSISLENWVNKYISDSSLDLILQMDIEGAEYRNLLSTSKSLLNRFRILVIEFHDFSELLINKTNLDLAQAFTMIRKTAEMIGTNAQNLLKLGKVVEKNTDNLNSLATRVLELDIRLTAVMVVLNDKK